MAEDEDDASKTEEPTPKKLSQAKDKGQTAQSQEVKHWVILFGAAVGVMFLSPWMAEKVAHSSAKFITTPDLFDMDFGNLREVLIDVSIDMMIVMAPIFGILVVLALGAGLVQSGMIWAPDKLVPKLSTISPIKGLGRIFSVKGLVEFAKSMAKILIVAIISFWLAFGMLGDIELGPFLSLPATMERMFDLVVIMTLATFFVMSAIAGLDFAYQRYAFLKQMKMTKQEVKDEMKQSEGDPQVKARIRKLRMERAQRRMMAAVPTSDVVVTNPTHYAIALTCKMEDMAAPKVVAKGIDEVALRIREVADENDVPIVENPPLARALYAACELDDDVPVEHYQAVAEVIGYIMRLKGPGGGGGGLGGGLGDDDGQATRH